MQTQAIRVITLVSIRFQPRPQCRVVLRHEVTGVERQSLVSKQLSAVYPRLWVVNVLRLESILNPYLAGAYHSGLLHPVVGGHRPQCLPLFLLRHRPTAHNGEGDDKGYDTNVHGGECCYFSLNGMASIIFERTAFPLSWAGCHFGIALTMRMPSASRAE